MPKKTVDEIKALIAEGNILAITMDTSIFDKFGCNLEFKALTAVEQFKHKDVQLVLSPVTLGEVRNHIAAAVSEAASKAQAGINQFFKASRANNKLDEVVKALGIDTDPSVIAGEQISAYVDRVGAGEITEQVDSDELLRRYFGVLPPFGKSSDKKAEFPDAIALLTLEKWAVANDTYLLAVSRDGDWETFAGLSEKLIHVGELSTALGFFNDQESAIAARVVSSIKSGSAANLNKQIQSKLEDYIDGYDVDVDANAGYYYEYEIYDTSIAGWDFADRADIVVVSANDDEVVVSFDLAVEAQIDVSFKFSAKDHIDKDYVSLGGADLTGTAEFIVSAVATFAKSIDRDPDLIDLDIDGRGVAVDFGYVEPDF
ncbi:MULTISPECIES: PIN domain-containing protein [unclassified Rhizobium]|uniref:PIN domain-containing protein n=1 Tax=unclassified Rhizobium TaxID=2613769 RepID=UPI001ADAA4D9|nr:MULTISPECIES: PIN domain-containing protein [unclassified Rhizobium]MBO9101769.1 DUF4935 domain-containing protein [Rhizobium sp. L58/93]MBO9171940.1 DUF4935 domain-containing protein [Rhizobium sp. L245/93]MBO9187801.1 DUF4935 domain-containing protein [Rhizobium sp. E27B/91]QXZ87766.1 DUF4935 domain-containing protein [Rhizobium sp. K1/93]QXZ93805.1 DUF4935 domain-containing protein [Rhizobium sp. K15/93]